MVVPNTEKTQPRFSNIVSQYKRANKLGETVKLYPTTTSITRPTSTPVSDDKEDNYFERTRKSAAALARGDFSFKDVIKEMPGAAKDITVGLGNTFAPAVTNFFKTTGSIIGEGLAYAIDENVRREYTAGNLDILPTITKTTQADLAKYTLATGLETAIFRSFPNVAKLNLQKRGGAGALQGIGFAISEGLAQDKSPEEIIKSMTQYGVAGVAINIATPYLLPFLKAEVKYLPAELKKLFQSVDGASKAELSRKLNIGSASKEATRVPISTPNSRYEAYLRSQGYEPYVPNKDLPSFQVGDTPPPRVNDLPVVDPATQPPNVFDELAEASRREGYEPYVPDADLPSIQAGGRTTQREVPFTQMVDEPVPTPATTDTPQPQVAQTTEPTPSVAPTRTEAPTSVTPTSGEQRVTTVPGSQVPVGEGRTNISRLEARMKGVLNKMSPEQAAANNISTYRQMNKADQIAQAARLVEADPEFAMAVLRGEKNPPNGLLYNSIALALEQKATSAADTDLIIKLASLRSTRAGQELSILTELSDDSNIVNTMSEIIEARKQRLTRSLGKNIDPATEVKKTVTQAEKATKVELKIEEAQKLIDDILC